MSCHLPEIIAVIFQPRQPPVFSVSILGKMLRYFPCAMEGHRSRICESIETAERREYTG